MSVPEGGEVVFLTRFDTYATDDVPYTYHCHILDHGDTGMMGQFAIVESARRSMSQGVLILLL